MEFGVWSFGREHKMYLKNMFAPDCITMAIVLVFLDNTKRYNRKQDQNHIDTIGNKRIF